MVLEQFHEVAQCVTAPRGFRVGTTACGIKADPTIQDLAILISDVPCTAAGTFTTSRTKAAPVLLCTERLASGYAQAVIVNSGNANCATGATGLQNAYLMTDFVASQFNIARDLVLCSSTGIIGRQLPIEKIAQGVKNIILDSDAGDTFAEAIMTTDTRPKRIAVEMTIDNQTVRLGGTTKGAGMIYPHMATMLCYLTTDAAIKHTWLQAELAEAVADSFNMICVDGDMSTNDTCLLFANGLADNTPLNANHPQAHIFRAALRYVTTYLAREIARDGEGATKLLTVHVRGASDKADAIKAARAITLSPILKCAITGGDPNWGRVVAALGASGCQLQQDRYAIYIGDVQVANNGVASNYSQDAARAAMAGPEVIITVDLQSGDGSATAWGCDLTEGYIEENTHYKR